MASRQIGGFTARTETTASADTARWAWFAPPEGRGRNRLLAMAVVLLVACDTGIALAQVCNSSWQGITVSPSTPTTASLSNYTLGTAVPPLAGCDLTTLTLISITLPEDTLADTITTGTFNGAPIAFVTKSAQAVSFASPAAVPVGGAVVIVLNDVTNPTAAGPKTLSMSGTPTSLGAIASTVSSVYVISAPTATPTITPTPANTSTPTHTATVTLTATATAGPCSRTAPDNSCIPGGGSTATDCQLEWSATAVPLMKNGVPVSDVRNGIQRNRLYCYDGDSRCDADGQISNNRCSFRIHLCVNNTDPRLSECVPTDVATFELRRPNAARPRDTFDTANAATLEGQGDGAPGGFGLTVMRRRITVVDGSPNAMPNHCSPPLDLVVPLRQSATGRITKGRRAFLIRSVSSSGTIDSDSLRLECRPSTCGNNVIETDHEQCDDGNRNNGDGCNQACQTETGVPTPTFTAPGGVNTATPTASGPTPTVTATATATTSTEEGIPFVLQPGGGTTGNCRGTCNGGSNPGGDCLNNNNCPGGGSCANRTCSGGPLAGTTCSNANQCSGCSLSPPQGTCAIVQANLLTIRVPLNGICVPRVANNDVACTADIECPSGRTCQLPKFNMIVGSPDGVTMEAPIVVPASSARFAPTIVQAIGTVCVGVAADGAGTIDCDGGRPDRDFLLEVDHNTTPGDGNNSGPANGLPDDPECDDEALQPDGSSSYACLEGSLQCSGGINEGMSCTQASDCPESTCELCNAAQSHPGVCNSPRYVTTSGTFGAGDLSLALPLSIQILSGASEFGPDLLACTADDTGEPPAAVKVFLTTGTTTLRVYDDSNTNGQRTSPEDQCPSVLGAQCVARVSGAPISCANLTSGMITGAKIGGGFPAYDQQIGDIATTFQFVGF